LPLRIYDSFALFFHTIALDPEDQGDVRLPLILTISARQSVIPAKAGIQSLILS